MRIWVCTVQALAFRILLVCDNRFNVLLKRNGKQMCNVCFKKKSSILVHVFAQEYLNIRKLQNGLWKIICQVLIPYFKPGYVFFAFLHFRLNGKKEKLSEEYSQENSYDHHQFRYASAKEIMLECNTRKNINSSLLCQKENIT